MTVPQLRLPAIGGEVGRIVRLIQEWSDAFRRYVTSTAASLDSRVSAQESKVRTHIVDLMGGEAVVSDTAIQEGSVVVVSRHTQDGNVSSTVEYDVLSVTAGEGFVVRARTSTGSLANMDGSILYAIVVDP